MAATASVLAVAAGIAGCASGSGGPHRSAVRDDPPAGTRPMAASGTASTVRVDLGHSLGGFPFHPGHELSATPNSWKYGAATNADLDALNLGAARVWLEFHQAYDVGTGKHDYAKWYDYLDAYAKRSKSLVLNWRSDYDPLVTKGTMTRTALFAAERDMLAAYKRHNPTIAYLESENEPDIATYYPKYKFTYQVVNAVNAMGLPGPKIKIGGPVTDVFTTARIGQFLDSYAADTDKNKKLDFISYHQYLINTSGTGAWDKEKVDPAQVAGERAKVDQMLTAHHLGSLPVLVTESGVFPGTRASSLGIDADYHIQAAGLAALHYWYLGEKGVTPFNWTVHHPDNDRKSMFADTGTGAARPYYNAVRMQSMLPNTRYTATSDRLSAAGIGVYGLAAADSSHVAVMSWNYQWTKSASYDSRVVLSGFTGAFKTQNVLVTRYRIPGDASTGELKPVERFVIAPRTAGSYTGQTLSLAPNELRMTVLTPTTKPVGPVS
jgi:hypothetical protein